MRQGTAMSTSTSGIALSQVVIDEDQIAAVVDVLRSGNLREGAQCQAFEAEFAAQVGTTHALTCNSGTAALQLAYQAFLRPGDEVLVPAFTFFATASMVAAIGAVPVFCDIDADTLCIDVLDAERRITARTRAIAPTHLFGNPANVSAVRDLARRCNLRIVWDAAQAHGATYDGQDVGSLDDVVCYSFYPSKNMTTGEGGMVCTHDDGLAETMRSLRNHGQTKRYVHASLGYNFRMTDIQAAIGRGQLGRLAQWIAARRRNAAYLREQFAPSWQLRVQKEQPGGAHSYHQFTVILDDRVDRVGLVQSLRNAGVGCEIHYPTPLHHQPAFQELACNVSLPVSEAAAAHVLSLPVHPYLSDANLVRIADAVLEAVGKPT
jgi:perosamine synthetase